MKPTTWTRRFEKSCREWQIRLGLTDWTLSFKVAPAEGNYEATVEYNCDSRQAAVTAYANTTGADRAERTAFHEMLHVLLADVLSEAALRASDTHPAVVREEHRVIERLLNAIEGRS